MAQPSSTDALALAVKTWEDIADVLDEPQRPEWMMAIHEIPLVLYFLKKATLTSLEEEATAARVRREVEEVCRRFGLEVLNGAE